MGYISSDRYWGSQIPRLINYGKHARLNLRSVKLFADGALGSWGAALLEPYTDKPDTTGLLLTQPETLKKMVQQFQTDGFQVVGARLFPLNLTNTFSEHSLHRRSSKQRGFGYL